MFQENISLFPKSLFLLRSPLSQKLANFLLIAFCVSSFCIDHPLRKESSSEPFEELLSWGKLNLCRRLLLIPNYFYFTCISVSLSVAQSIYLNPSKLKLWRKPLRSVLKLFFLSDYLSIPTKCLIRLCICWWKV